eukprot:688585_1
MMNGQQELNRSSRKRKHHDAQLLIFMMTRVRKGTTSKKKNGLTFWQYFIEELKNYPDALFDLWYSVQSLFKDGINSAMCKLNGRLTTRGITVSFIQEWRTTLKLIMAANDICEGLIASTKALHHLSHAYDYKIAGDLVSFHLNETANILLDPQTVSGAEAHIFKSSLRKKHKAHQANTKQTNIDLYTMKKQKSEEEKKQKKQKKKKQIAKYKKYDALFENGLFGESNSQFEIAYMNYRTSLAGSNGIMKKKMEYIKERLRYFIHCMELRGKHNIKLSENLERLEKKMHEICDEYGIWTNGSYIQVRDAYLKKLEEPVGLFKDNIELLHEVMNLNIIIIMKITTMQELQDKDKPMMKLLVLALYCLLCTFLKSQRCLIQNKWSSNALKTDFYLFNNYSITLLYVFT